MPSLRASRLTLLATLLLVLRPAPAAQLDEQVCDTDARPGGVLDFVVGQVLPSYDGHRESTVGMLQPIRPFYSLLIRVDPCAPADLTRIVCDLCAGDVPRPTDGGTRYRFPIRKGVRFHDGTPLTSRDVAATFRRIVFPQRYGESARQWHFSMVQSIATPDAHTVEFVLRYPSSAFLPALAIPFNFVYAAKDLARRDRFWHTRNVNGTGPFVFVRHRPGVLVEGRRNPHYHFPGRPYLDGFRAFTMPEMSRRVQAIRDGSAAIEFRGLAPRDRDRLVAEMGGRIVVQESDWNCVLMATPNHARQPFDDPRVRRALTLALDRWQGGRELSRTAIVKTVGGIVYPNHKLAASREELAQLAGYSSDVDRARGRARRLLEDAGQAGLSFELINRAIDQPYLLLGRWLVEQWATVGLDVRHRPLPHGPFYGTLRRSMDYDVSIDFNCQSTVNPLVDVSKFLGSAATNFARYDDPVLEDLYREIQRAGPEQQYSLMRRYERQVLDGEVHAVLTFWWWKIIVHHRYVRGWRAPPSHYLNQHLDQVWLAR